MNATQVLAALQKGLEDLYNPGSSAPSIPPHLFLLAFEEDVKRARLVGNEPPPITQAHIDEMCSGEEPVRDPKLILIWADHYPYASGVFCTACANH
jgi:hypothetical protein